MDPRVSTPRSLARRAFIAALLLLGAIAAAGWLVGYSGARQQPYEHFVAVALLCAGGAAVGLRGLLWQRWLMVLGLAIMFGAIGFHARALLVGDGQTHCGCLSLVGPLTHGWYLLLCGSVAALGLAGVSSLPAGRHTETVTLSVALGAGALGWLLLPIFGTHRPIPLPDAPAAADPSGGPSGPRLSGRDPPTSGRPLTGGTVVERPAPGEAVRVDVSVRLDAALPQAIGGRLLFLDREGRTLHVYELTLEGHSTELEVVVPPPGREGDGSGVAGSQALETVGLDALGTEFAATPVEWKETANGPPRGRATIELRLLRGARIEGEVSDGAGQPVPGLDLVLSSVGSTEFMAADQARARAHGVSETTARARTDAGGKFFVAGWTRPHVFVRVATPGWIRTDPGQTDPSFAAATLDTVAIPIDAPREGEDTPVVRPLRITVGELLFATYRVEIPGAATTPGGTGLLESWVDVELRRLEPPPCRHQQVGWAITGDMPYPLPARTHVFAKVVALDSAAALDPRRVSGVGIVRLPGYASQEFPLYWQPLRALDPPLVRLEPRRPEALGRVRLRLRDLHPEMGRDADTPARAWVKLWDLDEKAFRQEAPPWTRCVTVVGGVADFPFRLPPGEYRVGMSLGVAPREFQVRPGEDMVVDLDSRRLSSLRLVFDEPQGESSMTGVVVSRLKSLEDPQGPIARVLPPGLTIMELNEVSTVRTDRLRQMWFTEGGVPIEIVVGRPGRETLVKRLELRHAGTAELRIP